MGMQMTTTLALKQKLVLKGEMLRIFNKFLEMNNSELLSFLKDKSGKGKEGIYPMFSLEGLIAVKHKTDVVIKGGIFYETSNDFVKYASDNGGETKNPNGVCGSIVWMLKKREEFIKTASDFVLRYHHDFFWKNGKLRPISMQGAADYINQHLADFGLTRSICYSFFTRVTVNKSIQVEEKEYQLRFFFTAEKHRAELTSEWLTKIVSANTVNGKCILSDSKLADKFLENFGFSLATRTINKFRRQLGLASSRGYVKTDKFQNFSVGVFNS